MRKITIKILSALLVFSFGFGLITSNLVDVHAETTVNQLVDRDEYTDEEKALINRLIVYYGEQDFLNLAASLFELYEVNPEIAEMWEDILLYWDWIEEEMVENLEVAPDGLVNTDKHAFIVLGFALKADGEMEDELIGRLEVALASANKYPDSYILVTGGVEKNGWTEGKRMRDWLVANGVALERIIVEEEAPDAAGNATNSFKILYNDYNVETVSLITSQYHLKRGSILYYAESIIKAKEFGKEPIKFIGEANAGWFRADKTSEPLSLKARSLRTVARVPDVDLSDVTSDLTGLIVTGKTEYKKGEALDITVETKDSLDYRLDVTPVVTVDVFDNQTVGNHTVTISFDNGNKVVSEEFEYTILADDVTPPVTPDPDPKPEPDKEVPKETKPPKTTTPNTSVAYTLNETMAFVTLLSGAGYLSLSALRKKK